MARPAGIHDELSSLQAELRQSERSQAEPVQDRIVPAAVEAEAGAPSVLEEQLRELGGALSGWADGAEDIITEHPIATVLAAFVLGIAVGRLLGRE